MPTSQVQPYSLVRVDRKSFSCIWPVSPVSEQELGEVSRVYDEYIPVPFWLDFDFRDQRRIASARRIVGLAVFYTGV